MLRRRCRVTVQTLLRDFPAVALLGSRQVGKTTLAKQLVGASYQTASGSR
jgi:predicted AAA+ superfamily ATPase